MKVIVINGPNLNMLGKREKSIYGVDSLESINLGLKKIAEESKVEIEFFQSNHEGEIIDKIQSSKGKKMIINPGAFTHYSIAIRDAILAAEIEAIEVHISNIYSRESFRHSSVISDICIGNIVGLGKKGYELALKYFIDNQKNSLGNRGVFT